MTRPALTKSSLALSLAAALAVARPAHAEDKCTLRGEPVMAQAVGIYDAPSDGTEIGHFTGTKIALTVLSFAETSGGRSQVETAGFRIKGFVRARDIPAYTTRAVPVYAGHLFIAEGRRVSIIGAGPGRVHVEKQATSPIAGVFQGWAPCDAVSLAPKVTPGWAPPGEARGFLMKRGKLDLFTEAHGDLVSTLTRASDSPGVLFWSGGAAANGFVHIEHHGDLVIDAWARAADLSPLPPGETADQVAPSTVQPGVARIQLQGRAKVFQTTSAVLLRGAATDAAVVIGGIDAGVDIMVLDVVAGWASVMPTTLGIAPSGAGQFWVRARDLGI